MNCSSVSSRILLWALRNADGAQLQCEAYLADDGFRLRCCLGDQELRTSRGIGLLDVDSWARVYLAFYRTEGWLESAQKYSGVQLDALSALAPQQVGKATYEAADTAAAHVPTAAVPILRYWTLRTPQKQLVACELVRAGKGLEVQLSSAARAQPVASMSDALRLATAWKDEYEASGWGVHVTRYRALPGANRPSSPAAPRQSSNR